MSRAVRGPEDSKATTFPRTVRHVSDCAFAGPALKSVVLNEGLETLGECQQKYVGVFNCARLKRAVLNEGVAVLGVENNCGVFQDSGIEEIVLPDTLKELGRNTFV